MSDMIRWAEIVIKYASEHYGINGLDKIVECYTANDLVDDWVDWNKKYPNEIDSLEAALNHEIGGCAAWAEYGDDIRMAGDAEPLYANDDRKLTPVKEWIKAKGY
jgi:hypothetical protein